MSELPMDAPMMAPQQSHQYDLLPTQPVFIGYTQNAQTARLDYRQSPLMIASLADFESRYGKSPVNAAFRVKVSDEMEVVGMDFNFYLHAAVSLFFENGGQRCYILSLGDYENAKENRMAAHLDAIEVLKNEFDANLVVLPDIISLPEAEYIQVAERTMEVCAEINSRILLLDLPGFAKDWAKKATALKIKPDHQKMVAMYGPWGYFQGATEGLKMSDLEFVRQSNGEIISFEAMVNAQYEGQIPEEISLLMGNSQAEPTAQREMLAEGTLLKAERHLQEKLPLYASVQKWLETGEVAVPISGAVSGIIATNDRQQGLWAPAAGQSLKGILGAQVNLDHEELLEMNRPESPYNINIMADFQGRGPILWSALMMENANPANRFQHIRRMEIAITDQANYILRQFSHYPAVLESWQVIANAMAEFMHDFWQRGAFAGTDPAESWGIKIGVGTTLTQEEADQGIVRVELFFAPSKPGEFVILRVEGQLRVGE